MSKFDADAMDRSFGEDPAVNEVIFRHTRAELAAHFAFLDELREGGTINMLGAYPILAEVFDLTPEDARAIWSRWVSTFSKGLPVEIRVARAEGWRSHEGMPGLGR